MNKSLSIIIVTYNSRHLIIDCLDSIRRYNDLKDSLEIIIVDNNSNDQQKLAELITAYKGLDLVWLPTNENRGYGAANNKGVQKAKAPYVLIMNPDIRLIQPVFQNMLKEFQVNKNLAMAGVRFSDNSVPLYLKPEHHTVAKVLPIRLLIRCNLLRPCQVYMSGSFLLFDKKSFLQTEGFDENIFLYFEEADITNRLQNMEKETKLLSDIEVFHLTDQRKLNEYLLQTEIESLNYYIAKFKLDRKRILRQYLRVNKIKYQIACLLNSSSKKEIFKAWIKFLKTSIIQS